MAEKVKQKVVLDGKQYRGEIQRLGSTTKTEMNRVQREMNEAGNSVRTFTERTKKNAGQANGALQDLVKGFRLGFGAFGAIQLGTAAAGAVTKEVSQALGFQKALDQISVRLGLTTAGEREFEREVLDISARTNVEEDLLAAAALNATNLGASADEALKFSEVIAKASKLAEGVDVPALSEQIAKDLRTRGLEVTAQNAQRSLEALITGTRFGLGSITEAFQEISGLSGDIQRRAGLSNRQLINLLGGAGAKDVRGLPENTRQAIFELIKLTDRLGDREKLKGLLGTDFRDVTGKQFQLTNEQLEIAARRISALGDERVQRRIIGESLQIRGDALEGLLNLVGDRESFTRERTRAERDRVLLEPAFEKATSSLTERLSKFINAIGVEIRKSAQEGGIAGGAKFGIARQRDLEEEERPTAFALPDREEPVTQPDLMRMEQMITRPTEPSPEMARREPQTIKVETIAKIEVERTTPGFLARPSSEEVSRNPNEIGVF